MRNKKYKNTKNYTFLFLLGLFVIYFLYKRVDDFIIYEGYNYILFSLIIVGLLLFIIFLWGIKYLKESLFYEKVIVSLIFAYLFSVIFMIPVNYYNRYFYCKINASQEDTFKIINITKRRMSRGFNFRFRNKTVFVRGFKPIFNYIEENEDLDNYRVKVIYKKGLLNSNVILKTEIVSDSR